jgi:hypothetical protein
MADFPPDATSSLSLIRPFILVDSLSSVDQPPLPPSWSPTMRPTNYAALLVICSLTCQFLRAQDSPLASFRPDEQTLLLYHFDEGHGTVAKDFLLGTRSRGLWVGCYVGTDFWYSGKLDEVRVSDCVRYDPEGKLAVGGRAFNLPPKRVAQKAVRTPQRTGIARLELVFQKSFGGPASGWIYLKPPGRRAVIVGNFQWNDSAAAAEQSTVVDVSDEVAGDGTHTRLPRHTTRSSCGSAATASWATTTASRTAATSAAMRTEARPRTVRKDGTISSNGTSTSAATA